MRAGLTHIIISAANSILILKTEIVLQILLSSVVLCLSKDSVALQKNGPAKLVVLLLLRHDCAYVCEYLIED